MSEVEQRLTTAFGLNKNSTKEEETFFLDCAINQLLKTKHKDSFIYHKRRDHNKYQN